MTFVILFLIGILSTAYFFVYACLVGLNNTFTYFWILLGVGCIAVGLLLQLLHHRGISLPVWISRSGMILSGFCLLFFLVIEGIIIGYGTSKPQAGAEYMIILGARVKGEQITANLARRLWAAYDYLEKNPQTKVILSGGQGAGEDISEAEAMKRYLEQKGIAPERMILEDQSVNTDQNLEFSIQKIETVNASVVIVSNDFHIFRSLRIARKKGLKKVQGLGSATKWYTVPNMYVREAFAVVKYALCGQI